jgi:hypothetical protein
MRGEPGEPSAYFGLVRPGIALKFCFARMDGIPKGFRPLQQFIVLQQSWFCVHRALEGVRALGIDVFFLKGLSENS